MNLLTEMETKPANDFSPKQKEMIFSNMSDGVMTVDSSGIITYVNSACLKIFHRTTAKELVGKDFQDLFCNNKHNHAFEKLFLNAFHGKLQTERTTVKYRLDSEEKLFLNIDISLMQEEETTARRHNTFQGMMILFEDLTDRFTLRQREHDCAFIFAGLIFCIAFYLMLWSLLRFTLHIHLSTVHYTYIIEGITFLLFLEIVFLTNFSMKDIGLIPRRKTLLKHLIETVTLASIGSCLLIFSNAILILSGNPIKPYFIGGSSEGFMKYLFTSFVQEFLARGVIQTCVKSLMRVKYQKTFGVILTSLLFTLMHMPFGFSFMMCSLALSLVLGFIFEHQKNVWGCVILHWLCGYVAMSLFFKC